MTPDSKIETPQRVGSVAPLFGGRGAEQYNALHDALILAAADYALTIPEDAKRGTDTKSGIYQFVEETPATSMVVELVNALNKLGWRITPAKTSPNTKGSRADSGE